MEVVIKGKLLQAAIGIALITTLLLTGCGGGGGLTRQVDLGGGYVPIVATVTHLNGWDITLVSTEPLAEASLYFADGSSETYPLDGLLGTIHSDNAAQMTYLKASTKGGDYWYFDNAGHWLPHGYLPKFWSSLSPQGRSASSIWVGGNELSIASTDQYSEVKVFFSDQTTQTFNTNEKSGSYNLVIAADNVEAIRITLASDGSPYYFDAAGQPLAAGGAKWYEDAD
jgi:hypothetical protein